MILTFIQKIQNNYIELDGLQQIINDGWRYLLWLNFEDPCKIILATPIKGLTLENGEASGWKLKIIEVNVFFLSLSKLGYKT